MREFVVRDLPLEGVKVFEPVYYEDARGYFCETYSARTLAGLGIETVFVQDNHALSVKAGTIRGIHYQLAPHAQTKLLRCIRGRIRDFAVDLRRASPTFKQWVSVELSEENRKQVLVPQGFGHAYITLTDNCEVLYKTDEWYYPECDRGIRWNDPELGIDWGLGEPVLSEKDARAPLLREAEL